MRIRAVQHAIPTATMTNEVCLRELDRRLDLQSVEPQTRQAILARVGNFMDACGTQVRHLRDDNETSLEFVLDAARSALEKSDTNPDEVEFLIYVGVGRGWIEPATANVVQAELGLPNCTCFDLLDACASWLRALQVAHSLITSGAYRCGMIVNCECTAESYLDLDLHSVEDVERRLACFTIGEAATATIVDDSNPGDDFYFRFINHSEHYPLCMIPLPNFTDYLPPQTEINGSANRFFSRSEELMSHGVRRTIDGFRNDPKLGEWDFDLLLTHSATTKGFEIVFRRLQLDATKWFDTHPAYGNTVSAAVPLAMSLAQEQGRLKRGSRVLTIVPSAGMSLGFATFTF